MEIKINEISSVQHEVTFAIEADIANSVYKKSLRKIGKFTAIPGFRKGKAPLSMVENMYGDYIRQDFYDTMMDEYYPKALEEKKLNPINHRLRLLQENH